MGIFIEFTIVFTVGVWYHPRNPLQRDYLLSPKEPRYTPITKGLPLVPSMNIGGGGGELTLGFFDFTKVKVVNLSVEKPASI